MMDKFSKKKPHLIQIEKLQIITKVFRFSPPVLALPRQFGIEKWLNFGLIGKSFLTFDGAKFLRKEAEKFLARFLRALREVTLRSQPSLLRAFLLLRDSRRTPAQLELMMSPASPVAVLATPLGLLVVPLVLLVVSL